MSPKGRYTKKHHKDESSDIYVEDKQFEKKKYHNDKSSDKHGGKDKRSEKKKKRKDESSDIDVENKPLNKENLEDNQHVDFVYYDPSIFQDVDMFGESAQHSNDEAADQDEMN